jgi:plastocyanin
MAHTDIVLKEVDGIFVPSQSEIPVVKGDTIAFSTSDGKQVALFFSPGAVPVLSPSPQVPTTLAAGKKLEFTFTSSEAGAYSVYFEIDASRPPAHFPVRPSNVLLLETETPNFGGPNTGPRGG